MTLSPLFSKVPQLPRKENKVVLEISCNPSTWMTLKSQRGFVIVQGVFLHIGCCTSQIQLLILRLSHVLTTERNLIVIGTHGSFFKKEKEWGRFPIMAVVQEEEAGGPQLILLLLKLLATILLTVLGQYGLELWHVGGLSESPLDPAPIPLRFPTNPAGVFF